MQHGPGLHMGGAAKKLASFTIALKSKRQVAEGTYEFTFEKPKDMHFTAGQHVRMSLINPPETDAEGDKRFFTMASTPQEPDLRFAWRVRDTAFKRIMGRMQPGEMVVIEKLLGDAPKGSFVLHEDGTKPAVFITGGIGIIPAYAMIKDALERTLPHAMYLFYSNRHPEDAPYLTELQTLATQHPQFTLIATMTEAEKSATAWQGETGQINQTLLEKYVHDLQTPIYYVAGLPEMASAMQTMLAHTGVSPEAIRAEEFRGFNLNELQNKPKRTMPQHFVPLLLVLLAVIMVAVHVGGTGMVSHNLAGLSFANPLSYLIVALILAVIAAKIMMIRKFKHSLRGRKANH